MTPSQPPRDDKRHMWRQAGIYGAVGIEVASCVVLGAVAGHYGDGWLGCAPWCFFLGTSLGCAAAVRALQRVIAASRRPPPPL